MSTRVPVEKVTSLRPRVESTTETLGVSVEHRGHRGLWKGSQRNVSDETLGAPHSTRDGPSRPSPTVKGQVSKTLTPTTNSFVGVKVLSLLNHRVHVPEGGLVRKVLDVSDELSTLLDNTYIHPRPFCSVSWETRSGEAFLLLGPRPVVV